MPRGRRAVGDAADRPAGEVGVVERVVGALGQEHRARGVAGEQLALRRVGLAVGPERHEPEAVARVVAEEQRRRGTSPGTPSPV